MKHLRWLVAITIIAATLTACGSPESAAPAGKSAAPTVWGTVTGTVHDAAGKPLPGTLIVPTSADSSTPAAPEKAVTTDQDGRYEWQLLAGSYDLVARKGEQTSASVRVRVATGQSTVADLVLPG